MNDFIDTRVVDAAEIRRRVHEVLQAEVGPFRQALQDSDELERDLDCDSLDRFELTQAFEIEFGLNQIPDKEVKHLKTVGDLVAYFKVRAREIAPRQTGSL